MRVQIDNLIDQYDGIFWGKPWYGDGVIEKLEKMDSELIAIVPMGKLHSVVQLVRHMTAWKRYLIEKMDGNDNYRIVADSEVEWPTQTSPETWLAVVNELKETHRLLIRELKQKTDDWLSTINPGTEHTFKFLVQGLIHHDVYHIGQIGIINKLIAVDAENCQ